VLQINAQADPGVSATSSSVLNQVVRRDD